MSSIILAKGISNQKFEKWLKLEISGYFNTNPLLENSDLVPEYRIIPGHYENSKGEKLFPEVLNAFPIREGVEDLENVISKNGWLSIISPICNPEISEMLSVNIHKFVFRSEYILTVLNEIRIKLIEYLFEIEPIIDQLNSTNRQGKKLSYTTPEMQKLEQLVVNGNLFEAIEVLINSFPEKRNIAIALMAKLRQLKENEILGILNTQDIEHEKNKLIFAILDFPNI